MFRYVFPLFLLAVFSCRNDVYSPNGCYNDKIKSIISSNCTMSGCHNTKDHEEHLDLSTYDGLMKIVTPRHPSQSTLYRVITSAGEERMPPDHKLSKEEITAIKSWISYGAPENTCAETCDTSNVTFSGQVMPILKGNCTGCHSSGNVILTDYNNVKNYAASGALMKAINRTGPQPMPPSYTLNHCDIRTIAIWVNAGMPNN